MEVKIPKVKINFDKYLCRDLGEEGSRVRQAIGAATVLDSQRKGPC